MRRTIASWLWIATMPGVAACSHVQPSAHAEAPQVEAAPSATHASAQSTEPAPPAQGQPKASEAAQSHTGAPSAHAAPTGEDSDAQATAAIVGVHGGAGPWVVAGYRMGQYALHKLGLAKGSFDLEVTHHSPREVQYSCIADGAAAATGASLGRLSLSLAEAPGPETRTTYLKRSTREQLTLQTTPEFAARYKDVPRPQLMAAGQEVLHLPDAAIFREVSAKP